MYFQPVVYKLLVQEIVGNKWVEVTKLYVNKRGFIKVGIPKGITIGKSPHVWSNKQPYVTKTGYTVDPTNFYPGRTGKAAWVSWGENGNVALLRDVYIKYGSEHLAEWAQEAHIHYQGEPPWKTN